MSRPRGTWLLVSMALFAAAYVLGVLVRGSYGIGVTVRNHSQSAIKNVIVSVEPHGERRELPDLEAGKSRRVFVSVVGESHIALSFSDGAGTQRQETIAGYVESGYCGAANATVEADGAVRSEENIDPVACWKSWIDFAPY